MAKQCCTPEGQIKRYVDCIGCDRKPIETKKLKQTAVEWLLQQIENKNGKEFSSYYQEFVEKAKEMEKEHIVNAHNSGKNILPPNENGEQYYNETYNNGNTNL